jgi:hypothetical protein
MISSQRRSWQGIPFHFAVKQSTRFYLIDNSPYGQLPEGQITPGLTCPMGNSANGIEQHAPGTTSSMDHSLHGQLASHNTFRRTASLENLAHGQPSMNNSPHEQLAPWTTRHMDNLPHGQIARWTTRLMDRSPSRQLTSWTKRPMGNSPLWKITPYLTHPMSNSPCWKQTPRTARPMDNLSNKQSVLWDNSRHG